MEKNQGSFELTPLVSPHIGVDLPQTGESNPAPKSMERLGMFAFEAPVAYPRKRLPRFDVGHNGLASRDFGDIVPDLRDVIEIEIFRTITPLTALSGMNQRK